MLHAGTFIMLIKNHMLQIFLLVIERAPLYTIFEFWSNIYTRWGPDPGSSQSGIFITARKYTTHLAQLVYVRKNSRIY